MLTIFFSPKGGQGCSTLAAAWATSFSRSGETILAAAGGDACAILGRYSGTGGEPSRSGNLTVRQDLGELGALMVGIHGSSNGDAVVDLGTVSPVTLAECRSFVGHEPARFIMVVRNCYIALRAAMDCGKVDLTIVVEEPGRALRLSDARDILGGELVSIPLDPAVARAIDAGLLEARLPSTLAATVGEAIPA